MKKPAKANDKNSQGCQWKIQWNRAIFVWPWKMVSVSVRYLFYQPMNEKIKTWTLRFPAKKTLIWRSHCSISQSCCSMKSKRSIGWFLESSRAWSFFSRAFAQPTKSHVRLYPFDKPIKSLYFRSFVVSVCSRVFISRSYESRSSRWINGEIF